MQSSEIRQKFFEFFEARGHRVVPSSSLIPDDPSVLLTTAGMQQFKPYYTGDADSMTSVHPMLGKPLGSKNAVSIQKSFRTSDIDEVGDERHLTFFEMMGNFSFGGYFKEGAIKLAHEFLTSKEWMDLEISYVTIFQGKEDIGVPKDEESKEDIGVPKDEESKRIWQSLGIADIREEGMEDVFWGPTGSSGPCGPTTEIYCKNGAGQDIEVWNIVFNEFFFNGSREELLAGNSGKKLERLKTPGVDTGMGLERLVMVVQKTTTIFETDLFAPIHSFMRGNASRQEEMRIIADHVRAVTFLLADGVRPSNKERGYILRRLIRRAIIQWQQLGFSRHGLSNLIKGMMDQYGVFYEETKHNQGTVDHEFYVEAEKFDRTLKTGAKEFFDRFPDMKIKEGAFGFHQIKRISGDDAFYFHQSYGLTLDVIKDFAKKGGHIVEVDEKEFESALERHREISRAGSQSKFGGHGLYMKTGEVTIRDESEVEKVTRLHTATHLMHAALRAVLGPEVRQDGSDITVERTRFDFRFGRKVTPDELKKVEDWVNEAVEKDLTVKWEEMSYEEAIARGALGFFHEKYPVRVKVYTMFDPDTNEVYSKELCGGPHVAHTNEVGRFRIVKEESSSAGVRRIRGVVE
ncbi:MAG: alanine--tRNA ligase [Candidatus Sungbacteria bacterium]|nr:alanine--tRNA ligase [Candidatus Sungbacteria bacterium]